MATKSSKTSRGKKGVQRNNKMNQLILVALVVGVLGVITVGLSSASPFTSYLKRLRSQGWSTRGGSCSAVINTSNANATGNNMYTSVRQSGSSSVNVRNTTTSYTNTGGRTVVGC